MWSDEYATYSVVVLPDGATSSSDGYPDVFLVEDSSQPTHYDSVRAINSADRTEGRTVAVTANYVGTRTSAEEFIKSLDSCSADRVSVLEECVPATVDASIHVGVLYDDDGDERNRRLYVSGISNEHQTAISTPERGRYRIVGRVVPAHNVSSHLEGKAILVEEMTRIGDLPSRPSDAVRDDRTSIGNVTKHTLSIGSVPFAPRVGVDGVLDTDELTPLIAEWAAGSLSDEELQAAIALWASNSPVYD